MRHKHMFTLYGGQLHGAFVTIEEADTMSKDDYGTAPHGMTGDTLAGVKTKHDEPQKGSLWVTPKATGALVVRVVCVSHCDELRDICVVAEDVQTGSYSITSLGVWRGQKTHPFEPYKLLGMSV